MFDESSVSPETIPTKEGICPACGNEVLMQTDDGHTLTKEVGHAVICNHCAAELEIVETEPLRFELLEEAK